MQTYRIAVISEVGENILAVVPVGFGINIPRVIGPQFTWMIKNNQFNKNKNKKRSLENVHLVLSLKTKQLLTASPETIYGY